MALRWLQVGKTSHTYCTKAFILITDHTTNVWYYKMRLILALLWEWYSVQWSLTLTGDLSKQYIFFPCFSFYIFLYFVTHLIPFLRHVRHLIYSFLLWILYILYILFAACVSLSFLKTERGQKETDPEYYLLSAGVRVNPRGERFTSVFSSTGGG